MTKSENALQNLKMLLSCMVIYSEKSENAVSNLKVIWSIFKYLKMKLSIFRYLKLKSENAHSLKVTFRFRTLQGCAVIKYWF